MKRTLTLFACVSVCCAMITSCKNTKTAGPTQEEIQAQKVALADSVLAEIDAFVGEYIKGLENGFQVSVFELPESEKMVKPDFLLDPAAVNQFLSKSQKVNALAVYIIEFKVRRMYDMPLDEAKEAIAKLAMEVNHPTDIEKYDGITSASEIVREEYEKCKQNGDLAYFWQFQTAVVYEICYLSVHMPEVFFSNITDAQWKGDEEKRAARRRAVDMLANYDEEMNMVKKFVDQYGIKATPEEFKNISSSPEYAKQFRTANKDQSVHCNPQRPSSVNHSNVNIVFSR